MDAWYIGIMMALAIATWALVKLCEFLGGRR